VEGFVSDEKGNLKSYLVDNNQKRIHLPLDVSLGVDAYLPLFQYDEVNQSGLDYVDEPGRMEEGREGGFLFQVEGTWVVHNPFLRILLGQRLVHEVCHDHQVEVAVAEDIHQSGESSRVDVHKTLR